MGQILIAHELKDLLDPEPVPGYIVEWLPAAAPTPAGAHVALVPLLSRKIGQAELDGWPALRIIANCAVGHDNIDLPAAARRGIVVTNTPNVLTESTADLTWALILAVARRLKEGQAIVAEGRWAGWDPIQLLGLELNGAKLGIVGAGRIGQAVTRRALSFGMEVLYTARAPKPDFEQATGARWLALDDVLKRSDVVSVHIPSTVQTRGMFNAARFALMKPGALFVNTARGDLVDEAALVAALERGQLGGAGLDVFADEPVVPHALVEHPRVVVLPHIGSATTATRRAMAGLAVRNVRAVLAGDQPLTPVSR